MRGTRRRSRAHPVLLVGLLVTALLSLTAAPAAPYPRPGRTERVSTGPFGQGDGDSYFYTATNRDGRFLAFYSHAANLVDGDTNGYGDVFLRDQQTGTIERVSVATSGAQGNSSSHDPSLSADGRYVAFSSFAGNVAPGGTDITSPDIFVRDRETGVTERVSVSPGGVKGDGASFAPSISADGRYVAFMSLATNLVPGDTNGTWDVFVHDRQTGTTERMSVASDGTPANYDSDNPTISADGRFVAFQSNATNLVRGDVNRASDIFVHDRVTGATVMVTAAADGTPANQSSFAPAISDDGRYVAFESWAFNLVPADANRAPDIFVHDRLTRTTERVSVASDGTEGPALAHSYRPAISGDGRYVVFESAASLVPGDDNGAWDVFVHDRMAGTTERVSVTADGAQGAGDSRYAAISGDGRSVLFQSAAANLVPGDTNGVIDVFLRDRGPTVGVGGLDVAGTDAVLEVAGWATLSGVEVTAAEDAAGDGAGPIAADIVAASITYRPEAQDLLLRLRLVSMPGLVVGGTAGLLYRWTLSTGGSTYEVRAQRLGATGEPPATPQIELHRCAPACARVAPLAGSLGTTGPDVLASVPLDALGITGGAALTGAGASVAFGDAAAGAVLVVDDVELRDATIPTASVDLGFAPASTPPADVAYSMSAPIVAGGFSLTVDASSVPPGDHRLWARACLGSVCGALWTAVPQ